MMSESGDAARNSRLLADVKHIIDEGGEYWTRDREKRGGRPEARAVGTNPVSS
jgi:hypothetical protein